MSILCLAAALTALSAAQTATAPFAGRWRATFEGRTFITLDIQAVDGTLAGGISLGNIEVNQQGIVRRAEAAREKLTPIVGVALKGSTLTFSIKEGHETDRFELRLLDNAHAELSFILNEADRRELADSGVPAPRPIRLAKGG